ncbi:Serine/threonine-protein kinase sepA [Leucoagaricus sp. SymC.cos]|nr:Serine/threonine-protein kinase sepA [Leucoagaricus sp. SymC.cos]
MNEIVNFLTSFRNLDSRRQTPVIDLSLQPKITQRPTKAIEHRLSAILQDLLAKLPNSDDGILTPGLVLEGRALLSALATRNELPDVVRRLFKTRANDAEVMVNFLNTVLEEANILPTEEGKNIILDVVKGLCYLHQQGVVHSDLKGSNVLISDEERALIMDFGISHIAVTTVDGFTSSAVSHTPNWAPLELHENKDKHTRPAKGQVAVVRALVSGELPARPQPGEDDCDLIDDWLWNDLMMKCWQIIPKDRPTAENVRKILEEGMARNHIIDSRPPVKAKEDDFLKNRPKIDIDMNRVDELLHEIELELKREQDRGAGTVTNARR